MGNLVIVGGGVAGLSTGIYAQMRGYNAIILEKHNITGGNLTGWDRKGYHIDNCVHWLIGTNPNTKHYKMWKDLGALGETGVYQSDHFYVYDSGDFKISADKDLDKMRAQLVSIAPEDEKEIDSLIKAMKLVQGIYGVAGEKKNKRHNLFKLLINFPSLIKYYNLTLGELAKKFDNRLIRGFLTCLFTEEFSSLILVFFFALFAGGNAALPEGGSLPMARRMTERFINLGGTVMTGCAAEKINVKNGKAYSVTVSGGETIQADAVVIAADPEAVFGKMIDLPMPPQLEKMYSSNKTSRFSSFQCAFACDNADVPFKGEVVFDLKKSAAKELSGKTMLLREFSHEKDNAPIGKNVIQSMVFFKEKIAEKFIKLREDREKYVKEKKRLTETVVKAIGDKYRSLKDKLTFLDCWTPATYKRFTSSPSGSYMSFAFSKKFIPSRKSNRVKGLKNVILSTQWIQALGGLPIAAECGKIAVKTIERLKLVKKAVSPALRMAIAKN
ncbi:MAG: NAD(P)/FAD-dependent oxidoreductase [Clostridia bacterium]|nr:NAD(P)/FAD-dependent oxidoreductase [Clostridia bacterium]